MKKEKIFKTIFILLLIAYLTLYFSGISGYYEYQNYQKMTLTAEQIKQFEEDVKSGKEVDVDDYIKEERIDYNNKLANAGKKLSYTIKDTVSTILTEFFSFIAQFMTE